MLEQFQKHIENHLNFLNKSKVLIAISGGVDSVVLAHLCHKLCMNIALAHCNFNLRGSESDADEDFVLALAEDLEVEVFIESFETEVYAKEHKRSTQMAARELRYNWFNELASQLQFDYILTAHHADDNLETFLINFTRGTGLEGLTGIPEVNGYFVRPLLPFSRESIESYAIDQHITWRNDSSNASRKYLRNKLRHDVIPVLKEINPSILQSFQSTLDNLNETSYIVKDTIDALKSRAIVSVDDGVLKLKISEFKSLSRPKAYMFEVFKDYGFSEWDDVVNLLEAQPGKQVLSNTHRLIKDRDFLLLTDLKEVSELNSYISENDESVEISQGVLQLKSVKAITHKNLNVLYVDKNKLTFPLIIRKWEQGDVFYPLGMNGKKKLSKYFKDEKLSLLDKENVWLLCSGDDVVWVINRRADNRFRVTESTKEILQIELI
ncbi:tRNA lysidine(34) synthetase TilS [Gaetbulibacter saemankumensis]|uniref:tRNA lysidine(34) synthetase TilS n=1 Tax=Gaetbulibacter saemankumensis TaxID=311208 RepID=UPI0004025B29|nr:tRNA lysidine(34) synthetase TilS [Gaetbulibacter saemankumensis]